MKDHQSAEREMKNENETIPFCRMVNFHFQLVEIPFPDISSLKTQKGQFIMFQYTNVYPCAKFGDLKPTMDERRRPQIWACSWARRKNYIPLRDRTAIFFLPKVLSMLIDHCDQ